METITIRLKDYMVAYLYVRYGQCVESFGYDCPLPPPIHLPHGKPHDDTLYRKLYAQTVPQPPRVHRQSGNVTFVIPQPHGGKNPKIYSHLGDNGVKEMRKAVRRQILMELFDYMVDSHYNEGHTYKYALRVFLKTYHMTDLVSEDSMIRLFYDWRKNQKRAREEEQGGDK